MVYPHLAAYILLFININHSYLFLSSFFYFFSINSFTQAQSHFQSLPLLTPIEQRGFKEIGVTINKEIEKDRFVTELVLLHLPLEALFHSLFL